LKIIGITGGIGSGKSYVCQLLAAYGLPVYVADDRAKAIMNENEPLRQALINLFGAEVYHPTGALNRPYLSAQVFGHPERLAQLNALVHPAVRQDALDFADRHRKAGTRAIVRESALLYDTDAYKDCDYVATVYAPEAVRIRRVMAREGFSEAEVRARIARQLPEEEKMQSADFIIYNDEGHDIHAQVRTLLSNAGLLM